jgi:hypothetical protein
MTYRQRLQEIECRLGNRRLVYFGTRGTDARPLTPIRCLDAIFSQIAPLGAPGIEEVSLETLKGERVDLNRYSIDSDPSEAVLTLRKRLLQAFGRAAAVLPYRPTALLASAWFPRADRVRYLGVFHEQQACFEHKPWVETQLASAGVPVLPWKYYADDEISLLAETMGGTQMVLRSNRSDGGAGFGLLRNPNDLNRVVPPHRDGFIAAAPLISGCVPVNVGACVFPRGEISVHAPSVQLIGLATSTNRLFGYCGNDFEAVSDLDGAALDRLERVVVLVGRWLAAYGYMGAYGVDAIFHEGEVYLAEVNPRFQGCSVMSAELAREMNIPDIFLDHIAAFLGLAPPTPRSLRDLVEKRTHRAHVICYNRSPDYRRLARIDRDMLPIRCELLARPEIGIAPEGILFDAIFEQRVTDAGTDLRPDIEGYVRSLLLEMLPDGLGVE